MAFNNLQIDNNAAGSFLVTAYNVDFKGFSYFLFEQIGQNLLRLRLFKPGAKL